jgi:hypothetical protein
MLKVEVHLNIMSKNLGYATIMMTLETYKHVAPGLKDAAAGKSNDVLVIRKLPLWRKVGWEDFGLTKKL